MRSGLLTAIGAVGALATLAGAWPLLSGRNFTRNGELRPRRAPAALWRAGGAMVSTGGLLLVALAVVMGSSATVGDAQAIGVVIIFMLGAVLVGIECAWLVSVVYRHKLLPWDRP